MLELIAWATTLLAALFVTAAAFELTQMGLASTRLPLYAQFMLPWLAVLSIISLLIWGWLHWGMDLVFGISLAIGLILIPIWVSLIAAFKNSQPGDGCLITLRFMGIVLLGPLMIVLLYGGWTYFFR